MQIRFQITQILDEGLLIYNLIDSKTELLKVDAAGRVVPVGQFERAEVTRGATPFVIEKPLDVSKDHDIAAIMDKAAAEFGKIDFLLHSIAFASLDDLRRDTIETSRDGFKMAMEISAYDPYAAAEVAAARSESPRRVLMAIFIDGAS